MITIDSTEQERYENLKNAGLVVVPWDRDSEITITSPDETISHALKRFAGECGLFGKEVSMSGINERIRVTKRTVDESIAAMRRQQADLLDLGKMFTVLEAVLSNAVLLEVEPFRYPGLHKAKLVSGEYQYISAFHDFDVLHPVKITVEKYIKSGNTNVHVIITVGKVGLSAINDIIKRSVAYTGVHPSREDGESLFSEDASFTVNIQQLAGFFNTFEGIILKNFPNMMLSQEQLAIKQKILDRDT